MIDPIPAQHRPLFLNRDQFVNVWVRHFQAHSRFYRFGVPLIIIGFLYFQSRYQLGLNVVTPSLPSRLVLIEKGVHPSRGEMFSFRWHGGAPWPDGAGFLKIAAGMPGDIVSVEGRNVYLNGKWMGVAKERTSSGEPLSVIAPGTIPPGRIYAYAPHPDSLDSRYAKTGLIPQQEVIGVAHELF